MSKFASGQIVMTCGVADKVAGDAGFAQFVTECIARHLGGDWGDLCAEDKKENELSLKNGYRLLSSYMSPGDVKVWVITDADRSVTTALFPDEY
jgi:hypothetical protein